MATLVLSVAGAAAGSLLGPVGMFAGRIAGALAGYVIDQAVFGAGPRSRTGPRLSDLDVMTSTEGAPIARVYGRARISGQVIWATQLEEVVTRRNETSGGKGGLRPSTTTTTYSYFANFAVGLCEGEIGSIARIWADGKLLDLTNVTMRVHRGSSDQAPDPLIVAKEGAANAPAYRDLAYVVFERLALENFGNRIPQLSFEIVRPIGAVERMTRAVTLIPGTTEFGYEPDTIVQVLGPAKYGAENRHVAHGASDVMASLDDLQAICPNIERVAIVVGWFGDDLRAQHCKVRPGIDNAEKKTHGGTWSVAGLSRAQARLVSQVDGRAAYGGTPSDNSVKHLIAELKARGIKITLYPFLMMDIAAGNTLSDPWSGASSQPVYPWRGRITCDPAPGVAGTPDGTATAATQIGAFFSGSGASDWSYRRMVLHYAQLAVEAGGVDAFLIGSELKGLTRVRAAPGVYPAVDALVTLAGDVKAIVGSETVVTYGADWSEYGAHVVDANAQEVRFPLDPLWASPHIDAIGIDYYPPLSDWRIEAGHADASYGSSYDRAYLAANLQGGEAYDWYYADVDARIAQDRTPITDGLNKPWIYRAKDIWNFWSRAHIERVGGVELASSTAWVPQSKPIWLTETGCPAVDKGANQPSVFPDAKSSEAGLPYFSNGKRDDLIQRRYLETMLSAFDVALGANDATNPVSNIYGGRMVDASAVHLWTWDARPYPIFPAAADVWGDVANWETGHWLTGRYGGAPLNALVDTVLADCGVSDIASDELGDGPSGYVVDRPMTPRAMLEPLSQAYAFNALGRDGQVAFVPRGGAPVIELTEDDLVQPSRGALAKLTRAQESELPREVTFGFTDEGADYRRAAATSRRLVGASVNALSNEFAIVTEDSSAARRAEIFLQDLWAGRESASFALPPSALALTPGDVVALTLNDRRRLFEVLDIVDTESRAIKARSIDPEIFDLPLVQARRAASSIPPALGPVQAWPMDLPTLDASDPPVLTRIAVTASPWPGQVAVWRSIDGLSYARQMSVLAPAIMGETLDDLPTGPASRWDLAHRVRVQLYGGMLSATTREQVLAGANSAAVQHENGAWEVLQFANAELVDENTYELSLLLRAQAGTEHAMAALLPAGARFVVLDAQVVPLLSGLDELERDANLRFVAAGRGYDDSSAIALSVTPQANALMPLAPVHIKVRQSGSDLHVSWIRRTRRDGDSWVGEVPLGESSEAYALDIMNGASVVRTIEATAPTAIYTAAQQIADFGALQSSLHLRVAQISETVGRGFVTERVLTL